MKTINKDTVLWNTFKQGSRDSFASIYNLHIDELLSYGYRVTSNRQLIKDSIQDLFLGLWLNRDRLSETDSIKFYLFRSLRNRILRNLEMQQDPTFQTCADVLENVTGDFSYEHELVVDEIHQQQTARLQKAIVNLPKRQQEVIQLRYHHNFSLEEIANLMQLSNQSVRNLLHKAINQLRIFFEMAGWFMLLGLAFYVT